MLHSIAFAAAAVWAVEVGSGAGGTALAVDTDSALLLPANAFWRRLEDSAPSRCGEVIQTSASCVAGLPDYESCLECTSSYVSPAGGNSGASAGGGAFSDDCDTTNEILCGPIEACPCAHPCFEEYSAAFTCLMAASDASCIIACGGGSVGGGGSGGGGSSNASGSGTGSDSGGAAVRIHMGHVASLAVAAVAWGILTE